MTKSSRKNVSDAGKNLGTACIPGGITTDQATTPGFKKTETWNTMTLISKIKKTSILAIVGHLISNFRVITPIIGCRNLNKKYLFVVFPLCSFFLLLCCLKPLFHIINLVQKLDSLLIEIIKILLQFGRSFPVTVELAF